MSHFRFFPSFLLGVLLLVPVASAQQRSTPESRSSAAVARGDEHLLKSEPPVQQVIDPVTGHPTLVLTPEAQAATERRRTATLTWLAAQPRTTRPEGTTRPPERREGILLFLTVDNTFDDPDASPGNGVCQTFFNDCTLRAAIQEANALADNQPVDIEFAITFGPGGLSTFDPATNSWTISPISTLPTITQPALTINGLTQGGASCGNLVNGVSHDLNVVLDGSAAPGVGLDSSAPNFTVRGLVVRDYGGYGVIAFGSNSLVECNYVGTDVTGEVAAGNAAGVYPNGIVRNNVVSGNQCGGIYVFAPSTTIARNLVGSDDDGNQPLGNGCTGISVDAADVTVTTNLASANGFAFSSHGIHLLGRATRAVLRNNTVGLTRLRANPGNMGNGVFGILASNGARNNDIGLPGSGNGNFVGTNFASGIVVYGTGTNDNRIRNNTVGLDASGNAAPNYQGIFVGSEGFGSPFDTVVGGLASGAGNVASGNNAYGVVLNGDSGSDVEGNTVGLTSSGTARPNGFGGVIFTGSTGGSTVNGNTVSGNAGIGVTVLGASVLGAVIRENRIGTNAAGTAARPNGLSGIVLDGAFGVTVRNNTISANTDTGIFLDNGTNGHVIEDNFIGTNVSGANLGNGLPGGSGRTGIYCQNATGVRIGKNFSPNTIAFNASDGIFLSPNCQGISVVGNIIHSNGGLAVDLAPDGVNPNDNGDGDTGANEKLNFPLITSAENNGTNSIIAWTLNARPSTTYELLFCRLPAPDPSGFGECEGPNALATTTTNGSGNASGTQTLGAGAYPAGTWVTANATKVSGALPAGYGPTSEFGRAVQVTDTSTPPGLFLAATNTSPLTVAPGGSVSFAYTITNNTPAAVSGDLFFTAKRAGNTVAQGVIVSGTLPAGQSVSSSYTQGVPASAPPGNYAYTLRIGQFPNVTVDSKAFTVVVTGNARGDDAAADSAATWILSDVTPWLPAQAADETASASRGAQALPTDVSLVAAYPNPFSRSTTVGFALPSSQRVRMAVYDVLGREVAVLVDGELEAGRHEAVLDGSGLPSGVYLIRLAVGDTVETQRVTLLR